MYRLRCIIYKFIAGSFSGELILFKIDQMNKWKYIIFILLFQGYVAFQGSTLYQDFGDPLTWLSTRYKPVIRGRPSGRDLLLSLVVAFYVKVLSKDLLLGKLESLRFYHLFHHLHHHVHHTATKMIINNIIIISHHQHHQSPSIITTTTTVLQEHDHHAVVPLITRALILLFRSYYE